MAVTGALSGFRESVRRPGSRQAVRGYLVSNSWRTPSDARSFRAQRGSVFRFVAAAWIASMLAFASTAPRPALAQQPSNRGVAGGADAWLEATFEPAAVYVQAQAIYVLRLYQAIDIRELRFEVPRPALGELRPLDDGSIREVTRDGRRYRVTERRFAVFPFASGDFELPGVHVAGLVPVFGGGAPGARAPLRIDAPPATLSVLPIPAEAGADQWLPARALSVVEEWSPAGSEVRAGQPLKRTIRIEAHGVEAALMPVPDLSAQGLSAHPQPPRLDNRIDGEWIVGAREQSWRIVPSRTGELVVPELRLRWWDAVAGRARVATLPARKLSVAGMPPAKAPPAVIAASPDETASGSSVQAASGTPRTNARQPEPVLAGAAILAILALAGVALRVRWRAAEPLRKLRAACRRNDPREARDALLRQAREHWPAQPPRSLGELAARLRERAACDAVLALDRHLYRGPAGGWEGRDLLACVAALKSTPRSRTSGRAGTLPPLYPP